MIDIVLNELRDYGHAMGTQCDDLEHIIDQLESWMEDYDTMEDTLWRQFYNQTKVIHDTSNLIEYYERVKKNLYYDENDPMWGIIYSSEEVLTKIKNDLIYDNLKLIEYIHDLDECNFVGEDYPEVKKMADEILDDYGRVIDNQISKELGLL
jgi:hypothetical protein